MLVILSEALALDISYFIVRRKHLPLAITMALSDDVCRRQSPRQHVIEMPN